MIDRALRKLFNAEAPPPMIWEPQIHGRLYPDLPYFLTRVRQGISKIPLELQHKFAKAGHQIHITRRIEDAAELLPNTADYVREKGWDIHKALKASSNCHAAYFKYDGHIVIPQLVEEKSLGIYVKARQDYFAAHEIGHVFDYTGGELPLSAMAEFRLLCVEDLKKIPARQLIWQTKNGGNIVNALADGNIDLAARELFADLFAEHVLGLNAMSKLAPNAALWVQTKIAQSVEDYRVTYDSSPAGSTRAENIYA